MVSHEFRTPLGIIQSSAEILRDYFDKVAVGRASGPIGLDYQEHAADGRDDGEHSGYWGDWMPGRWIAGPAPLDLGMFCRRVVDEVQSATERRVPDRSCRSAPCSMHCQADEGF
jgi:signal transduction histidine kinase